MIKLLSVVGTVALLLVSGGIFHHHIPGAHHLLPTWPAWTIDGMLGTAVGLAVLGLVKLARGRAMQFFKE